MRSQQQRADLLHVASVTAPDARSMARFLPAQGLLTTSLVRLMPARGDRTTSNEDGDRRRLLCGGEALPRAGNQAISGIDLESSMY